MRRTAFVVAAQAVLALMLAGPSTAQYPFVGEASPCSDTTVSPGGSLCVSGVGWQPGSTVSIEFDGEVIGTAQVDEGGEFQTTVTVPAGAGAGAHVITVRGTNIEGLPDADTFTVTVGVPGAVPVPITGSNISLGAVLLTILVVVGLAAFAASRRRKAAEGA